MALSELTPRICPPKPAFFIASPNEPPISPTPTIAMVSNSKTPTHDRSDQAKLRHQLAELLGEQGLRSVAERMVRIVMDFDEQTVGAGGHRGARHGCDFVATSGAVGGVADYGQVGELLHHRDGGNVHRVASVSLECANAALTQDDLVIAAGHDVFRGEQQFFNGCRDA